MSDALLLLVPFFIGFALLLYLRRFRVNRGSWRELWTTTYAPSHYTAEGRRLLPFLYAATVAWFIAVVVVVTRS